MRQLRRGIALSCCVLACVTIVCVARATSLQHLDTRELTLESNDIVVGQVESVRSYWNDSHTKILTDVAVRVSESFKGATGSITLTQLGGQVDGMRYDVPGCPVFRTGEQALLFVWRDSRGRAQVNGLAQGKFDLHVDASGTRTVQRTVPGFAAGDAKTLRTLPSGQVAPQLRYDDLVREIRRTLAEAKAR